MGPPGAGAGATPAWACCRGQGVHRVGTGTCASVAWNVPKFVTLNQRGKKDAMTGQCPRVQPQSVVTVGDLSLRPANSDWHLVCPGGALWGRPLGLKATFSGHHQVKGLVSPAQGCRGPGRSRGDPDHTRPRVGPGHSLRGVAVLGGHSAFL